MFSLPNLAYSGNHTRFSDVFGMALDCSLYLENQGTVLRQGYHIGGYPYPYSRLDSCHDNGRLAGVIERLGCVDE